MHRLPATLGVAAVIAAGVAPSAGRERERRSEPGVDPVARARRVHRHQQDEGDLAVKGGTERLELVSVRSR